MGYLPSDAPLPPNSLTPIPQSWVDSRNAKIGLLGLLTTRARSITDCYAPPVSFIASSGPNVAAQVAQAQANNLTSDYGTPAAPSSGNIRSSNPAPVVLPLNQISYGTLGGTSMPATSSCDRGKSLAVIPQPRMMMPQPAPAISSPAVMGMSGYAPQWGTFMQQMQAPGMSIDWLATICSHPLAAILISAAVGWGIQQMTKGRR